MSRAICRVHAAIVALILFVATASANCPNPPAVPAVVSGFSCNAPNLTTIVLAGVQDAFAPPQDAATPGPEVATLLALYSIQPPAQFDFNASNRPFGHTFTFAANPGICGGELEVRMHAYIGSDNDGFGLLLNGTWGWSSNLAVLNGGTWSSGADRTWFFDLSCLPVTGASLIASMNTLQRLDLYTQDDTVVDYARLRLCTCPVGVAPAPWSQVKALYRD